MINQKIRINNDIYSFFLPMKESDDFPRVRVFEAFDSPGESQAFGPGGAVLIEKFWDYKNKNIGINKDGTLKFLFRIRRFDGGFKYDSNNQDKVIRYLIDELHGAYDSVNGNHQKEGNDALVVKLPDAIRPVSFSGRDAFTYSLGGGIDADVFVVPISDEYFAQINFIFIDNSHGRGMNWKMQAKSDANKIIYSMKIERL